MSIIKDFYKEDPIVAAFTKEEVEKIRKDNNNIIVNTLKEENYEMVHEDEKERKIKIPNPVTTFEQAFQHFPLLLQELKKQGFTKPSPIQCQAWPVLLKGHDLVGIAQTGTGKTLAFLLPALIHIDGQTMPRNKRSGPTCLVLAPTRELALQIDGEVKKINYKGIKSICIYGGASRRDQLECLKQTKYDIVIATPGRLIDFINSGNLDVSNASYVVLDEADRMLDMGFSPQIRQCLIPTHQDKQVIMTTATWSLDAQIIARLYYKEAIKVDVGSLDLTATHTVTQNFLFMQEYEKSEWLLEFVQNVRKEDKVIIFVDRKNDVDDIASTLALKGLDCESIHGGREQMDRESALHYFREGTVNILIATDVASRGIDILDITHIVNYDFPTHLEEYVHRIGRTGRAGKEGESLTILTRRDSQHAASLIKIVEEAGQEVPEELIKLAERHEVFIQQGGGSRGRGRGRGGNRGRNQDNYAGNSNFSNQSFYKSYDESERGKNWSQPRNCRSRGFENTYAQDNRDRVSSTFGKRDASIEFSNPLPSSYDCSQFNKAAVEMASLSIQDNQEDEWDEEVSPFPLAASSAKWNESHSTHQTGNQRRNDNQGKANDRPLHGRNSRESFSQGKPFKKGGGGTHSQNQEFHKSYHQDTSDYRPRRDFGNRGLGRRGSRQGFSDRSNNDY